MQISTLNLTLIFLMLLLSKPGRCLLGLIISLETVTVSVTIMTMLFYTKLTTTGFVLSMAFLTHSAIILTLGALSSRDKSISHTQMKTGNMW